MNNEIQPLTLDLIRDLPVEEKKKALDKYHVWLKTVRKLDLQEAKREGQKIRSFKYRIKNTDKVRISIRKANKKNYYKIKKNKKKYQALLKRHREYYAIKKDKKNEIQSNM